MVAKNGRSVLLKYNSAGVTQRSAGAGIAVTINNEPVDITNADDSYIRKLINARSRSHAAKFLAHRLLRMCGMS